MYHMTDETKNKLLSAGLTKQMVESVGVNACVEALMGEDEKTLLREARKQLNKMYEDYLDIKQKVKDAATLLQGVVDAEREYGKVKDEKAVTVLSTTSALLNMFAASGCNAHEAVEAASYIMYAYLGGQARNIRYSFEQDDSGCSELVKKRL